MKCIYEGKNRKRADLILVVLASQSIESDIKTQGNGIREIRVHDRDFWVALDHMDRYDRENTLLIRPLKDLPRSLFFSWSILVIIGILWLVHLSIIKAGYHDQAVFRFGASAYFLRQQETFRAITALFFHADIRHLLGNTAGLLVLGSPLVRMTGYGSGPFLLLSAGTVGNLIAGGMGQDLRLSIGASTAVMGAAGLLAAGKIRLAVSAPRPIRKSVFKTLAPLAAAATLVAMFSQGENTDVLAHFLGFAGGLGMGILFFPFFSLCSGKARERICLALTLVIVLSALIQGILK